MDCEVLFPKIAARGGRMLRAMVEEGVDAGVDCRVTEQYQGNSPWLMSYGLGHPGRRVSTDSHLKGGGHLIGWDMGFWDRSESMRLTVDADHTKNLPPVPSDRWEATGFSLRNEYKKDGPIILVGLGRKTRIQFGFEGLAWELRTLAAIRAAYPKREVLYRPKKMERMQGVRSLSGPIEQAIKGASLVVCKHSNVAVDACIAGIPVVCEDGAAAYLYGNDLAQPIAPSNEQRLEFLIRLAYWQWKPSEAASAWKFLKTVLG